MMAFPGNPYLGVKAWGLSVRKYDAAIGLFVISILV
jgi:hypothetical protein